MKDIKEKIDDLYSKYKNTRVVTHKTTKRSMNKIGYTDSVVIEFEERVKNIIKEDGSNLNEGELKEITTYSNTIIENFKNISK